MLTILVHRSVRHVATHARLTHFSLCRLYTPVLASTSAKGGTRAVDPARWTAAAAS